MIDLIQQDQLLIGSKEAIENLSLKDHGRILVASDSHNHYGILLGILKEFGPGCDGFAFCGDGLGDLATIFSLAENNEEIRKIIPPVIGFAGGNCDPSSYPVQNHRQIVAPNRQILTVNGQNIMIVHGHREGVEYGFEKFGLEMELAGCTTGVFGHTHVAEEVYSGDLKFINPGSCSSPRAGQPAGFAILTVEKTFIDTAFIKIETSGTGATSYKIWQPN